MENEEKARIMHEHLLTDMTIVTLQNKDPDYIKIEPLRIYKELILCLNDDDFTAIDDNNIYLNVSFSPASISIIKTTIPVGSQIVTFDYNCLLKLPNEERIAVLLHEIGHAFNPTMKNSEGEFAADDFAICRGYGKALKESLQRNIKENPKEFDKEITYQRLDKICEKLSI